ncbi:hypothetical protein JXM67_07615 [candidate division WOR-3 bacterium]|nr:hypothetical protein [candidate division WOR-3 bacterium]
MNAKNLTIAVAAVLILAGTPALAIIDGDWEGKGYGKCENPITGDAMYPWQYWKGTISNTTDFVGEWYDDKGNKGYFTAEKIFEGNWVCEFNGRWYVQDEESGIDKYMGYFVMNFHKFKYDCKGEWVSEINYENGWMYGKKK